MIIKRLKLKRNEGICLKGKEKRIRLPNIKPAFVPKSLNPSPISNRSKTPVFSPKSPTLDFYFDEFGKVLQKNNDARKNWITTKQNLLLVELNRKIGKMSLSPIHKSEYLKFE